MCFLFLDHHNSLKMKPSSFSSCFSFCNENYTGCKVALHDNLHLSATGTVHCLLVCVLVANLAFDKNLLGTVLVGTQFLRATAYML